ncbi:hypothetical protein M0R04_05855 [Candidatus Dojkabacteria bacterium]|jgi:hypothetical protein|nr:hypothetical protein [Candidatus Dojkabacteria bacterium]
MTEYSKAVKTLETRGEIIKKLYPIYFYRRHMDIAALDILGLKLSPHHRVILRDWGRQKHYNVLLCSRGMGKSVLVAIYYVLSSLLYPNNKLMIIGGAGFRQSKSVMLEMEKVVLGRLSGQKGYGYARAALYDVRRVVNKDPSFWSIQFKNGSIVYAVPLGDGSTIRGLRALKLAQDESFLLPSTFVQQIIDPFLNVLYDPSKGEDEQVVCNQSIKTSTIDYSFRDFWKEVKHLTSILESGSEVVFNDIEVRPSDISVFEFNFEDSFYIKLDGSIKTLWGIDRKKIIQKKNSPNVDMEVWMAENKNVPMDVSGGYFPIDAIEKCSNVLLDKDTDTYPNALSSCSGQCILSIDTAPSSDNSAFVVTKVGQLDYTDRDIAKCSVANLGCKCPMLADDGQCLYRNYNAVVYAYERNKMPLRDRVNLIYELYRKFNIIAIAMDARGGGYEVADLLGDRRIVREIVGETVEPIFDPERNKEGEGLPILKLYTTTQDDNITYNGHLKGHLVNCLLLLPKALRDRPDNIEILEIQGHVETLVSQLMRIKVVPAGKSVRFDIESVNPITGRPAPGKKDLYSALLYGNARYKELYDEKTIGRRFAGMSLLEPIALTI